MSQEMQLPRDLQHLIEKREAEEQRQLERRIEKDYRTEIRKPDGEEESTNDSDENLM